MKNFTIILFLTICNLSYSQTNDHKEKFKNIESDVWMSIWDIENSNASFSFDTISYDDIPKYLDFRGTVVEALKWTDKTGDNILIQSVSGHFNWKDYVSDSSSYMLQDKWEIYAYLFTKGKGKTEYKRVWRVYDYTECFGVDWYAGFIPKATTVTDIDKDGVAEICMPYVSICRGGMDAGTMKIIMYEGTRKYALRGTTMVFCADINKEEGVYKPSENLKENKTFMDFMHNRWETHKCENKRFY
ncbi:MAG: M949_RS01915 family surface polysaccharide biosynthesis protein [Crocinitomicaceae bacterium]